MHLTEVWGNKQTVSFLGAGSYWCQSGSSQRRDDTHKDFTGNSIMKEGSGMWAGRTREWQSVVMCQGLAREGDCNPLEGTIAENGLIRLHERDLHLQWFKRSHQTETGAKGEPARSRERRPVSPLSNLLLLVPTIDGIQQEARGEENGDAGNKDGLPGIGQGRGKQG